MDVRVAQSASLILLGLVMERWYPGNGRVHRQRVAFQAKQVDLAALEQPGIGGAVRRVAGHTPFRLNRLVLENERAGFFDVTLKANRVL